MMKAFVAQPTTSQDLRTNFVYPLHDLFLFICEKVQALRPDLNAIGAKRINKKKKKSKRGGKSTTHSSSSTVKSWSITNASNFEIINTQTIEFLDWCIKASRCFFAAHYHMGVGAGWGLSGCRPHQRDVIIQRMAEFTNILLNEFDFFMSAYQLIPEQFEQVFNQMQSTMTNLANQVDSNDGCDHNGEDSKFEQNRHLLRHQMLVGRIWSSLAIFAIGDWCLWFTKGRKHVAKKTRDCLFNVSTAIQLFEQLEKDCSYEWTHMEHFIQPDSLILQPPYFSSGLHYILDTCDGLAVVTLHHNHETCTVKLYKNAITMAQFKAYLYFKRADLVGLLSEKDQALVRSQYLSKDPIVQIAFDCNKCLTSDPNFTSGYLCRAKIYRDTTREFMKAANDFKKASKLSYMDNPFKSIYLLYATSALVSHYSSLKLLLNSKTKQLNNPEFMALCHKLVKWYTKAKTMHAAHITPNSSPSGQTQAIFVEETDKIEPIVAEVSDLVHRSKQPIPKEACANCMSTIELSRCSGCRRVYYCSKECQRQHWRVHKEQCV